MWDRPDRRRQENIAQLLPYFWIGVMLLVVVAGYLLVRFLEQRSMQALNVTETPNPMGTITQTTPVATAPAPDAANPLAQPESLVSGEMPAEASEITYTVQEGDTLAGIARHFGVGLNNLMALNPSVTPEFIKEGDQLSILVHDDSLPTVTPASPGSQSVIEYQVAAGDTLAAIANRFGTTVGAIVRRNDLESPDQITEGQTLRIPVEAGAPSPVSPGQPGPIPETTTTPGS